MGDILEKEITRQKMMYEKHNNYVFNDTAIPSYNNFGNFNSSNMPETKSISKNRDLKDIRQSINNQLENIIFSDVGVINPPMIQYNTDVLFSNNFGFGQERSKNLYKQDMNNRMLEHLPISKTINIPVKYDNTVKPNTVSYMK